MVGPWVAHPVVVHVFQEFYVRDLELLPAACLAGGLDVLLKQEAKAIRLPAWIWQWIDQQETDRGHVIEEALRQYYKITPPTTEGQ
jgi:hypothetical protein